MKKIEKKWEKKGNKSDKIPRNQDIIQQNILFTHRWLNQFEFYYSQTRLEYISKKNPGYF